MMTKVLSNWCMNSSGRKLIAERNGETFKIWRPGNRVNPKWEHENWNNPHLSGHIKLDRWWFGQYITKTPCRE